MKQEEALKTLITAIKLATRRGAFEIEETGRILEAIKVFTINDNQSNNIQPEKVD